jgi:hypothetical protein
MMKYTITPGQNGYTPNAGKIARAIAAKAAEKQEAAHEEEAARERERAEAEYYDDNNCWPRPLGYFGTETDAHFYNR